MEKGEIILENSPYMESISASRAMLLSEEDALEGTTTISLETCADLAEEDISSFIADNFSAFIKTIRFLKKEDQELLLSYYLLSKTQNTLALIHKSTQTVCSFRLRMAVKTLGTFMLVGGEPTEELLHEVLGNAGMERSLEKEPNSTAPNLSAVVMAYVRCRNFQQVASQYGLHRPDVRRAMSRVSKALMDSKDGKEAAVAAWIHSTIDKANAIGVGYSKRKQAKLGHIYLQCPEITGQFRLRIEDDDFNQMFVSRASK
jgi:hypothetical protein